MLNLISTGKVTLAFIIIIILLCAAFTVTVVYYRVEVKSLKADIKEEQLQGVLLQDSLTKANMAIKKQNNAVRAMQIKTHEAEEQLKNAREEIISQKNNMINHANKTLKEDTSCQSMMNIIYKNQKEFLDGRTSDYNKTQ